MAHACRPAALRAAGALLGLGLALAGCGRATPSASVVTTTTTTTTLPRPVGIALSQPNGSLGFLGPVLRVSVVSPRPGASVLPPPPAGLGASLPSVRIAYRQFGSGPNLLLVMGERGTMSWWDPAFLEALAAHYTVTVFDLPGVGYSGPASGTLSLEEEGDVTAGLSLSLGLEARAGVPNSGVTLLGWGTGGDVALATVERHPKVASGLVLLDSLAPGKLEVTPAPAVSHALASTLATLTGLSRLFFPAGAASTRTDWLDRVAQLEPDDETAPSVSAQAGVAATVSADAALERGLGSIRLPVRVIAGEEDVVVPPANADALYAGIGGSKLIALPDAGYASFVSDEQRVLSALLALSSAGG